MDLARAGIALLLPFVTEVWQVYILIFLLQSASAAFTPTFQATIPDLLPEEKDYTRALSLSRLAYDLESLLSPTLAAALLTVIGFHWLFGGTVIGFLASAALVLSVRLPQPTPAVHTGGIYEKTTRGSRIYLATPRLRGLLALNLSVASAGAMVIVNTVVIVRALLRAAGFRRGDRAWVLRRRLDGRRAAAAPHPRPAPGPPRDAAGRNLPGVCSARSRGAVPGHGLVQRGDLHHRRGRSGVAGAADRLGPARGRLLRHHDADRPASAALGAAR